MDIETLVKKHADSYLEPGGNILFTEAIRASLTELAAEYEQKLAEDKRTHLRELQEASDLGTNQLASTAMQLQVAQERIRQMEAERVPEGYVLVQQSIHPLDCDNSEKVVQLLANTPDAGPFDNPQDFYQFWWQKLLFAAAPRRCHLCDYLHGHKIGCVNNPVDIALRAAAPAQEKDNRPANCRNRLSDEGKAYPRSGCAHCKTGGITGCPFKKESSNG